MLQQIVITDVSHLHVMMLWHMLVICTMLLQYRNKNSINFGNQHMQLTISFSVDIQKLNVYLKGRSNQW